ncbi:helix-turn-helix domain-containing protein [Ensifer sp. YR511]|uniref:helix-turn-helix domain-containing protein n=1 Tax=Ensifer sp. YR511 TaxID=1855294 RepID=UPI0008818E30|nr:AraC family transcriptional regulator [Ensifer sp. YR511]SDN96061.1 AraC-type DNA-binding protein [Ensifer sp. YR511]
MQRQETNFTHTRHAFLMNLKGEARQGEDFVDGQRIVFAARRPGSVIYIPPRSVWTGWDDGDATASYLLVSIRRNFAERMFGDEAHGYLDGLPPSIGFRDSAIEVALHKIANELKCPDPYSSTMVESQATQLFVQLMRRHGIATERAKGGLSPFDLKRALAAMEAQVDGGPSITDLSRELGITPRHFLRAFKQSTGISPHAFMARRRLERSAEMLRFTNLSATEIALECGFGGSSNFTIAFKRGFGCSPTAFRRIWRT